MTTTSGEYPLGHVIDPLRYRRIEEERLLANRIMLLANVTPVAVMAISRVEGGWQVIQFIFDEDGKHVIDPEKNELKTTTTIVQDVRLEAE